MMKNERKKKHGKCEGGRKRTRQTRNRKRLKRKKGK